MYNLTSSAGYPSYNNTFSAASGYAPSPTVNPYPTQGYGLSSTAYTPGYSSQLGLGMAPAPSAGSGFGDAEMSQMNQMMNMMMGMMQMMFSVLLQSFMPSGGTGDSGYTDDPGSLGDTELGDDPVTTDGSSSTGASSSTGCACSNGKSDSSGAGSSSASSGDGSSSGTGSSSASSGDSSSSGAGSSSASSGDGSSSGAGSSSASSGDGSSSGAGSSSASSGDSSSSGAGSSSASSGDGSSSGAGSSSASSGDGSSSGAGSSSASSGDGSSSGAGSSSASSGDGSSSGAGSSSASSGDGSSSGAGSSSAVGDPPSSHPAADTFKTGTQTWVRMDNARWDATSGKYIGADDGNKATGDPDLKGFVIMPHRGTTTHGIPTSAWVALQNEFPQIDTDKSGTVNAEELFSAVSRGTLDNNPDAKKAAMILCTSADLMNNVCTMDSSLNINKVTSTSFFTSDQLGYMAQKATLDDQDAPPSSHPAADTFKTGTQTWVRMDDARWDAASGKYIGADDGNKATADSEIGDIVTMPHRGTTTHGILQKGWDALKSAFDTIDTDHNGTINAEDLFSAVSYGLLDKNPDAKKTAMILCTSADLMNNICTIDNSLDINKVKSMSFFTKDQVQNMSDKAKLDDKN